MWDEHKFSNEELKLQADMDQWLAEVKSKCRLVIFTNIVLVVIVIVALAAAVKIAS